MAIYAIGDVQGCYAEFAQLLEKCRFDPAVDRVWLVGDLVNRGPASLEVLRLVRSLGEAATVVLGNHDLYLLMLAAGHSRRNKDDTLVRILEAPNRDELLDWLSRRPLLHVEGEYAMVHGGLLPAWSVPRAAELAREVECALLSEQSRTFLRNLHGNQPDRWSDALKGWPRLRVIVNALTRMRFCTPQGRLMLEAKGPPDKAPPGTVPWFRATGRASRTHTIVFGHWSALGFHRSEGLIALDSGCVWGGKLTAVRLDDGEVFQVMGWRAR